MFDSNLSATQLNLVRTMTADSMVNSGAAQDRGSEVLQNQHTGSIKPRPSEKITLNRQDHKKQVVQEKKVDQKKKCCS